MEAELLNPLSTRLTSILLDDKTFWRDIIKNYEDLELVIKVSPSPTLWVYIQTRLDFINTLLLTLYIIKGLNGDCQTICLWHRNEEKTLFSKITQNSAKTYVIVGEPTNDHEIERMLNYCFENNKKIICISNHYPSSELIRKSFLLLRLETLGSFLDKALSYLPNLFTDILELIFKNDVLKKVQEEMPDSNIGMLVPEISQLKEIQERLNSRAKEFEQFKDGWLCLPEAVKLKEAHLVKLLRYFDGAVEAEVLPRGVYLFFNCFEKITEQLRFEPYRCYLKPVEHSELMKNFERNFSLRQRLGLAIIRYLKDYKEWETGGVNSTFRILQCLLKPCEAMPEFFPIQPLREKFRDVYDKIERSPYVIKDIHSQSLRIKDDDILIRTLMEVSRCEPKKA